MIADLGFASILIAFLVAIYAAAAAFYRLSFGALFLLMPLILHTLWL